MSAKPEQYLKVGDWWYLPQQDKLVKIDAGGEINETASLDNLCQKALNYFLIHAGRLVTRDELLNDVWGVRDVSDGRISRVIRVLRVALGDDSREPRYIETIPKRGFRFIAPVSEAILTAEPTLHAANVPKQELSPIHKTTKPQPWMPMLVAGVLFLCAVLSGWTYRHWGVTESAVPFGRFEPVSSMDGLELYPDVSRDGRYMLYAHSLDFSSVSALIIQDLHSLEKKQLKVSTSGGLRGPIWSPDGNAIVYQRLQRNEFCEIRMMQLHPTDKTVLSDKLLTACGVKSMGARMSWSPDGQYIVYPDWQTDAAGIALMRIPAQGGKTEPLTAPPQTSLGDFAARFSPDGTKIAFLRDVAGSAGQIWVLDLATRSSRLVYQPDANYPGHISWTVDGSSIVFPSGTNTLSKIDLTSHDVSVLAYADASPHDVLITSDGRIFSSVGRFWQSSIRKVNNQAENPIRTIEPLDFATRTEGLIELNPQPGGPAAVLTNRSGNQQVWLYYPDGRQTQISRFNGQMYPKVLEFSPDGQKLLVQVNATIWLLESDKEPIALTAQEQIAREPSWGADSQTVYYKLSKQGRWHIMRRNLHQAEAEVFSEDLDFYLESPDGAYLVRSFNGNEALELKMLASEKVIPLPHLPKLDFLSPRIVLRKNAVYYSATELGGAVQIYRFNLKTGAIEATGVEQKLLGRRFFVSLDEQYVYQDDGKKGDVDIAELVLRQ